MSEGLAALRVEISAAALTDIQERALARVRRFASRNDPAQLAGTEEVFRRNVLGVAGEQSVLLALRDLLGDAHVRDVADEFDTSSDIAVETASGVLGVEVKTTTYDTWLRCGRSINANQLSDTDAGIYVWCVGPSDPEPRAIYLVGWSTIADVRSHQSHSAPSSDAMPVQRYSHAQDRYGRRGFVASPIARDAPTYGTDDPGFDEFAWSQVAGLDEDQIERDPETPTDNVDALYILETTNWQEGNEHRSGASTVHCGDPVRTLAGLAQWIMEWQPDGAN